MVEGIVRGTLVQAQQAEVDRDRSIETIIKIASIILASLLAVGIAFAIIQAIGVPITFVGTPYGIYPTYYYPIYF